MNKLSTRREGGVKKSQKFVYVECERPLAEQAVISEQDGILQKKVKRAGYNKRAGWNILLSKISEQVEFHSKEPSLMHCRVRKP